MKTLQKIKAILWDVMQITAMLGLTISIIIALVMAWIALARY